jgi:hypothetical protein
MTGLVLVVVRIEVLTMCALAGLTIGGSDIGMAAKWILAIIFVAVAASTFVSSPQRRVTALGARTRPEAAGCRIHPASRR